MKLIIHMCQNCYLTVCWSHCLLLLCFTPLCIPAPMKRRTGGQCCPFWADGQGPFLLESPQEQWVLESLSAQLQYGTVEPQTPTEEAAIIFGSTTCRAAFPRSLIAAAYVFWIKQNGQLHLYISELPFWSKNCLSQFLLIEGKKPSQSSNSCRDVMGSLNWRQTSLQKG